MNIADSINQSNIACFLVNTTPEGIFVATANKKGLSMAKQEVLPFAVKKAFDYLPAKYLKRIQTSAMAKTPDCFSHFRGDEGKFVTFSIVPYDDGVLLMVSEDNTMADNVKAAFDTTGKNLHEALEEAKEASKSKTRFLSNMSHDIRTPMNAIVGMTDIALKHTDSPERMADCLTKVKSASAHLLNLINEVLDMSSIESGNIKLNSERFSLGDLLLGTRVIIKQRAEEAGISYTENIEAIANESFIGDSTRIQQILLNLLNNAIKFTEKGGSVSFSLREERDVNDPKSRLIFTVTDTGMGMSEEFKEKLFVPFERSEDVVNKQIEGTGLGMSITKQLCEMMYGSISVESTLGVGSTFTVNISLLPVEQEAFPKDFSLYAGLGVVLWDTENSDDLFADFFAGEAMFCETAQDIDEVLRKASALEKRNSLWGIVCHISPSSDAITGLTEIHRKFGGSLPVVIVSSDDWNPYFSRATVAGVDAFLSYPLFRSALRRKLSELSRRRETVYVEDADNQPSEEFKSKKVLLVEDNALNREIAIEILNEAGVQCDVAENGKEALDKFSASKVGYYPLILMDVQMPIMDGHEATRRIRALRRSDAKDVGIVAMTANAFAEDVRLAKASGMNEFLPKPFSPDKMFEILKIWLG